jgi:hypothetical protein
MGAWHGPIPEATSRVPEARVPGRGARGRSHCGRDPLRGGASSEPSRQAGGGSERDRGPSALGPTHCAKGAAQSQRDAHRATGGLDAFASSPAPSIRQLGVDLTDPGRELTDPGRELTDPGRELPDQGHELPDLGHELADRGPELPDRTPIASRRSHGDSESTTVRPGAGSLQRDPAHERTKLVTERKGLALERREPAAERNDRARFAREAAAERPGRTGKRRDRGSNDSSRAPLLPW